MTTQDVATDAMRIPTTLDQDFVSMDIVFDSTMAARARLCQKLEQVIDTINLNTENKDVADVQLRTLATYTNLLNNMDKNAGTRAALKLKRAEDESNAGKFSEVVAAVLGSCGKVSPFAKEATSLLNYDTVGEIVENIAQDNCAAIMDSELKEDAMDFD